MEKRGKSFPPGNGELFVHGVQACISTMVLPLQLYSRRSFLPSFSLSLSRRGERSAYREPNNSATKLTVFRTDSPLTRGREGYVCKTEHGWRNAIIIVASHEEEKYPMTPTEGKKSRVP